MVLVALAFAAGMLVLFRLPSSESGPHGVRDPQTPAPSVATEGAVMPAAQTRLVPARPPMAHAGKGVEVFQLKSQSASGDQWPVQWNFDQAARLNVGDSLRIPLPGSDRTLQARVEEEASMPGARRLAGRVEGEDGMSSSSFSMTQASDGSYVVANFSVGERSFSLEASPGGGMLRDTAVDMARLRNDEAAHAALLTHDTH